MKLINHFYLFYFHFSVAAMEKLKFTQNPVELAKLTGNHYSTGFFNHQCFFSFLVTVTVFRKLCHASFKNAASFLIPAQTFLIYG